MIQNKRDLGGIPTKDGLRLRHGMLIRSAHLFKAEPDDLDGISTVIDLRTPSERQEAPDQVYGQTYCPLPIFDDMTAGISHENEADHQEVPDMATLYRYLVTDCAASFRNVLITIMERDYSAGAILWHCTEGKDRCGLTAALILESLGVDRVAIMADYLKTNEMNLPKAIAIRERLLTTHGRAFADSVYQAYIADEKYLLAAWDAMGSNYIADKLQIPNSTIHCFRQAVLTRI